MLATMLKASSYGNDSDVGSSMDIIMMLERDSIFNVRVTEVCFDEVLSAEAPLTVNSWYRKNEQSPT